MKIIKESKKIRLYHDIVAKFRADKTWQAELEKVIPGIYIKTYIKPKPTDPDLVCVGVTAGASYYVPKKYGRVFAIQDWGHWDFKIKCPVNGEETIVSQYLGRSAEACLWTGGVNSAPLDALNEEVHDKCIK